MGVVTVSSSAARTPLGFCTNFSSNRLKRPLIVAFKGDKHNDSALVATQEKIPLPIETTKTQKKKTGKANKLPKRERVAFAEENSPSSLDVDYNEAAAMLENIYKLSPASDTDNAECIDGKIKRVSRRGKKIVDDGEEKELNGDRVVRSKNKKAKRLNLDQRISLKSHKDGDEVVLTRKKRNAKNRMEKIEELIREYSVSTDFVSMDWRRMRIPPVLSSSEHAWLFKLMQPMKTLLQVKEDLQKELAREPADGELAEATNMSIAHVKKALEVGQAARNKLIKHNLRLVLFVINKYFTDFATGSRFQDLCQAGVKGLMTAIDRFEPNRRFRLSTYSLFWIRHAITRSMTLSSFTRVPFGLESVRAEIQKAKTELTVELQRSPTEEEIIERVEISPERYHDVIKASKSVLSLNSRHITTQEEFINGVVDDDGVNGDNRKQPVLLRLALDDVLDSLKPKESLVMRQRFGLDGKGDRTLGEIARNLNISREMVRKHEMKAFMKLKHSARLDYLRRYVV